MRETRRMKRLERNNKRHYVSLNLIPMLDVLSVLVFFLLFHSFNGDMPEQRIVTCLPWILKQGSHFGRRG